MPFDLDDAIAAVASPASPSARGIVRVSGNDVVAIVDRLLDTEVPYSGPPVRIPGYVLSKRFGSPLPVSVLLWPTARSYTGQPMAEFHLIGSPPILELMLAAVIDGGARQAERGEFTMRAFLNGRIDLLQAEAVSGVIDAADHDELQSALTQLGGGLTRQLLKIQSSLIAILGDLEAGLDFVEEDIEFISSETMVRRMTEIRGALQRLLVDSAQRLPSGYRPRVVLAGLPNAGKSTLFNCLADADLAIASTIAGTTRDYLCCPVRVADVSIELIDTAGWTNSKDRIQMTAVEHRQQQLDAADLVIWCVAADLNEDDQSKDAELRDSVLSRATQLIIVTTCVDRPHPTDDPADRIRVSALSGVGLCDLRRKIAQCFTEKQASRTELLATTSSRCRDSIERAVRSMDSAVESVQDNLGDELTAIGLREALQEFRSILGETWTDDILDHIFSSFCIGK
ncbi:MAG: tRNA modification GTPase [Fuerstiella sp.]|nr:tRNA modification GTPase [Fuerstiella sp.]